MSEYSLFARRVGLVGIITLVTSLKSFILLPILTKMLGAEGFGAWSQINVTVSLILPFAMLGLANSMLRFLSVETDKKKFGQEFYAVFLVILFVGTIFGIIIYLLSNFLSVSLLKNIAFSSVFRITSIFLIIESLNQVTIPTFRIFGEIKKYSLFTGTQTLIEIIMVSFFVLSDYGLKGAITGLIITRAISLIISFYYVVKHIGFTIPNFYSLGPYLVFGLPLISSIIFEIVISSSDRYVIGFFLGSASVGIYSAAYGIGTVSKIAIGPLTYILSPTIFKSFDENKMDEVKKYLSYSLKYFLMVSIPAVFGVTVLAGPLLQTLTTSEFVLPGLFIVPIVALSMIFEGLRAIFGDVLMLFKRTSIFGSSSIIAGSINLILNIILVPYIGIIGAALVTLISYGLIGLIMCYYSRKYLEFDIYPAFVMKSIISSTIMIFPVLLVNPVGIIGVIEAAIIGCVTYFITLFILDGFEQKELNVIRECIVMFIE